MTELARVFKLLAQNPAETGTAGNVVANASLSLKDTGLISLRKAYQGCAIVSYQSAAQTQAPTYPVGVEAGNVITICPLGGDDKFFRNRKDYWVSVMFQKEMVPEMAVVIVESGQVRESTGRASWVICGGPGWIAKINGKPVPTPPQADYNSESIRLAYSLGKETTSDKEKAFLAVVKGIAGFEITKSEYEVVPLIEMLLGKRSSYAVFNATWPIMGPWIGIMWGAHFFVMINGQPINADMLHPMNPNELFDLIIATQAVGDRHLYDGATLQTLMKKIAAQGQ